MNPLHKLVHKMLTNSLLLVSILVCDVRKQQLEVATRAVQSGTLPDDYRGNAKGVKR